MNDQMLRTAFQLHQQGNLAEASRLYGEVLRANPKHFDALYLLGFANLQRGAFDDAERLMGRALEVNPSSLDALRNRGMALQRLNRHADALGELREGACDQRRMPPKCRSRAERHCPSSAVTRKRSRRTTGRSRRNLSSSSGGRSAAMRCSNRASTRRRLRATTVRSRCNPISPKRGGIAALALIQLGRLDDALESLDRTLALRADDADSWNDRGHLLMMLNRHAGGGRFV